jgi:hypothetical protein
MSRPSTKTTLAKRVSIPFNNSNAFREQEWFDIAEKRLARAQDSDLGYLFVWLAL